MTKPTRLAAVLLAVVFLAGVLFGFVAHSFYERTARAGPPPPPSQKEMRDRYLAKLQDRLSLSPEQVNQVRDILDQTGQRFQELRDRMEPEFETARLSQRQRITAVLTPEQQPKYEQIIEEHKRKHEKASHR